MFTYPKREKYQYIIETDIGYIVIRYDQAYAQDTFDYFDLMEKGDIFRIQEYRKPYIDNAETIPTKGWKQWTKRKLKNYLKKHFFDYHNEIIESLHKTRRSKYEDEHEPKQKGERKQLFQSVNQILHEATGIPIDQVYERLTLEQVGRLLDKSRAEYYDTFEDGQAVNVNVRSKMGLSQEQKDLLQRIKDNKNGSGDNDQG